MFKVKLRTKCLYTQTAPIRRGLSEKPRNQNEQWSLLFWNGLISLRLGEVFCEAEKHLFVFSICVKGNHCVVKICRFETWRMRILETFQRAHARALIPECSDFSTPGPFADSHSPSMEPRVLLSFLPPPFQQTLLPSLFHPSQFLPQTLTPPPPQNAPYLSTTLPRPSWLLLLL